MYVSILDYYVGFSYVMCLQYLSSVICAFQNSFNFFSNNSLKCVYYLFFSIYTLIFCFGTKAIN